MAKNILTYGTFDMFHYGHIELLRRAKELSEGGTLTVGVSSDAFNKGKNKLSFFNFEKRKEILESIRYVDRVIPEENWEQKITDIKRYDIDIFVMGDDWKGKFDFLQEYCSVVYLTRTPDISTTEIKKITGSMSA